MILAPHPDDEFLNCTAVLSRAREITVVYATNGDFEGRAATEIRFQESVSAMRMLNLGPENMIVLGYGDRGGTKNSSFLHKLFLKQLTVHTVLKLIRSTGISAVKLMRLIRGAHF